MKKLFYATKNKAKIQNMKDRLKDYEIELVTPYDIELEIEVSENGNTVIDNAVLKAKAYYDKIKLPTIAGDSSLFIEKFASQPGLFVRRVNEKYLSDDEYKLYDLIWKRLIASQMASAVFDTVSVDISCGKYIFKSSGSVMKFKGYLALYDDFSDSDENVGTVKLPPLTESQVLDLIELLPEQHFTEPPSRFTEATLIKFLEEKGIGRPSTIAPTISLIISRGYVVRDGKFIAPTPLGEAVVKLISEHFDEIVDYKFTAQMENDLDEIASSKTTMESTLGKFYKRFRYYFSR